MKKQARFFAFGARKAFAGTKFAGNLIREVKTA
jgi:hypothetical protein